MGNSMKIIRRLPDAPAPTKAAYKKPVLGTYAPGMRVVEIPSVYEPKPAPIPKPKTVRKKRTVRKKERKPRAVYWTAEKEERLIQMYKDGAMYEEMAKVFGKSRGGISARIQKLANQGRIEFRYNAREWTAEDLTIMKEMRAEGKSFGEIADRLGRGYKACSEQYRRTYGKDS